MTSGAATTASRRSAGRSPSRRPLASKRWSPSPEPSDGCDPVRRAGRALARRRVLARGIAMSLYRILLLAFPRDFRARFGDDMSDVFEDRLRDAHARGPRATFALWTRTMLDVMAHGLAERRSARIRQRGLTRRRIVFQSLMQDVR